MIASDAVETCIPWAHNTTQQIDLAFNIFFMVYFFIRVKKMHQIVSDPWWWLLSLFLVHCCIWQTLVHAGTLLFRGLLHHSSLICINLPWQARTVELFDIPQNYLFPFHQLSTNLYIFNPFVKQNISPSKNMDWSEIFESSSSNDFPRYPAVSQHFEDKHQHQV